MLLRHNSLFRLLRRSRRQREWSSNFYQCHNHVSVALRPKTSWTIADAATIRTEDEKNEPPLCAKQDKSETCPSSSQLSFYAAASASTDPLLSYFLERVIDYGIPSIFAASLMGFGFVLFRSARRQDLYKTDNPVADLYADLYGDEAKDNLLSSLLGSRGGGKRLPKNLGVPVEQYLLITHLNARYESYDFSMHAATESKASAAAVYRRKGLQRALGKALGGPGTWPLPTIERLEQVEHKFLEKGQALVATIQQCNAKMTQSVVDQEMQKMGFKSPFDIYGNATASTTTDKKDTNASNQSTSTGYEKSSNVENASTITSIQAGILKQESVKELHKVELNFIRQVVKAVGPEHAPSLRAAFLGNAAVPGGSEGMLLALKERPLKTLMASSSSSSSDMDDAVPRVYVTQFKGRTFPEIEALREKVTAICRSARPGIDKVVVVLQSPGGTVTGYGLISGQFLRLKEKGIELIVAVEQVAASGGYLAACVADRLVLSPFGALGSIGVVTEMPNVHERLKREGVEFQTVTAGKYKRTITPFKQITPEDLEKTQQDVEDIWAMFRGFVAEHRPQLNLDEVATGEVWYGTAALERKLCDEIQTLDNLLIDFVDKGCNVYEIRYAPPGLFGGLIRRSQEAEISSESQALMKQGIQWFVKSAAKEIQQESFGRLESRHHQLHSFESGVEETREEVDNARHFR